MNAETFDLVSREMDTAVPEKCSSVGTGGQTLGAQAARREWKLANTRIDATTGSE